MVGDIGARRRGALIEATIHEIAAAGSLDVTVGRIARRAGVSPALAFHYFGGKDRLFLATMRSILAKHRGEVCNALRAARGPRDRVEATIRTSFSASNFHPDVVAAWLNFYVLALTDPSAGRLLTIYRRRLHSNLVHGLRPLVGMEAGAAADRLAALIDGLYLRAAMAEPAPGGALDGSRMTDHALTALARDLEAHR